MKGRENEDRFPELFGLIEEYAGGDSERQAMALKVIAGAYLPSVDAGGLRDAKRVVDSILEGHGYFVPHGGSGGVHPQSVYAVLNVAKHSGTEDDRRWGASRLFRMVEALGRRARSGESYPKHTADVALLSASLTQLANTAQASRVYAGSLN
jgi:hypothetical protein